MVVFLHKFEVNSQGPTIMPIASDTTSQIPTPPASVQISAVIFAGWDADTQLASRDKQYLIESPESKEDRRWDSRDVQAMVLQFSLVQALPKK